MGQDTALPKLWARYFGAIRQRIYTWRTRHCPALAGGGWNIVDS
jgi:hypothetical protein